MIPFKEPVSRCRSCRRASLPVTCSFVDALCLIISNIISNNRKNKQKSLTGADGDGLACHSSMRDA